MSGAKETPRQKMIGMMYLVYTALLAMNVSADILDAFANVSDGQQRTNGSITRKINNQYDLFQEQFVMDSVKTHLYWEKALEIRAKTDTIVNFIEKEILIPMALQVEKKTEDELLNTIDDKLDPKDPDYERDKYKYVKFRQRLDLNARRVFVSLKVSNFGNKDNYDAPYDLMINKGKGEELKNRIDNYRNWLVETMESAGVKDYASRVSLMTDKRRDGTPIIFKNANGESIPWEEKNFAHIVFAAQVAIINQFVGDIQTAEFDAVAALMGSIGAGDYKFNSLEAKCFPKSDYITQGQDFEAEVFIAALDTEREFNVQYGMGIDNFDNYKGTPVRVNSEKGIVKLKIPGRNIGEQKVAGVIEMKNPETGAVEYHPFHTSYMVAPPSATIAPTKMMIMYSGLENPVAVSAPGYKQNEISVKVTGGEVVRADRNKGEYIIKPNSVKEKVHVFATAIKDGKTITLKDEEFRVKQVPLPQATIGGFKGGDVSKGKLIEAGKVEATMEDFDFGGFEYTIVSYKYSYSSKGTSTPPITKNGADFDSQIKKDIRESNPGQRFYFENIKAKAPDGEVVDLSSIIINIK
ncbi:MAG: hypothetical protein IJK92_01655 [Bacteroidales bacterium]|nr:hypothetical protein [Bacteroidales bacterium]